MIVPTNKNERDLLKSYRLMTKEWQVATLKLTKAGAAKALKMEKLRLDYVEPKLKTKAVGQDGEERFLDYVSRAELVVLSELRRAQFEVGNINQEPSTSTATRKPASISVH